MSTQDIAFFNDFEIEHAIVQPVLDFSELPGQWAIEAEALVGNNDVQSTLVGVAPGDTLVGTVTSSGCASTGICTSWTITLTDTTSGKSTTQTTKAVKDALNEVDVAVLETYDVSTCTRLPANGEVPFFDNALTTSTGAAEPETYTFYPLAQNGVNAEVPTTCGFGGKASGNDYTLYFGASPTLPDGGADDSGPGSSSSGAAAAGARGERDSGERRLGQQLGQRVVERRRQQRGTGSSGGSSSGGGSGSSSGVKGVAAPAPRATAAARRPTRARGTLTRAVLVRVARRAADAPRLAAATIASVSRSPSASCSRHRWSGAGASAADDAFLRDGGIVGDCRSSREAAWGSRRAA